MSDSELVDGLFLFLSTFLATEWTARRQPYKFHEYVHAACSAPSHDKSRIFLESGLKAWVAYFVVSPKTANAIGQADQRRKFAALECLPVGERKKLAVKTNEVQPHPTVATLILSMEREARQINSAVASLVPSKRPHTEHDDFGLSLPQAYPSPGYSQLFSGNSLATANPARAAGPRAMSNLMPAWTHPQPPSCVPLHKAHILTSFFTGQYEFVPAFSSTVPFPSSLQLITDISRGNINLSTSPEAKTLVGADIAELDLFPEYLAGAIQRYDTDPKTAAVAIRFPANSIADVNCAMIIEVLPNKVERLSSLLFNAHLETNGNSREVILPGGFDEVDMPVMAHAIEHLLFMGTKKYSKENGYEKYLSAHSGTCNAYTASTSTNYYFEIAGRPNNDSEPTATNPSPLKGAIDRYAQFFVELLGPKDRHTAMLEKYSFY